MVLESTQTLIEMSTRNLPGGKGGQARKAENSTAICEPNVWIKYGSLDVLQSYGPSWPLTEIALPYLNILTNITCFHRPHQQGSIRNHMMSNDLLRKHITVAVI
jgi:hypothetical protein